GLTQDEQNFTANPLSRYQLEYLYAGVQVSWTIFDGFASRHATKAGLARLRAEQINYDAQQQNLLDDLDNLERQLNRLSLSVQLEERRFTSAQNIFNSVE